jgi:hypothetical protein
MLEKFSGLQFVGATTKLKERQSQLVALTRPGNPFAFRHNKG